MHDRLLPGRVHSVSPATFAVLVAVAALFIVSIGQVSPSPSQLVAGLPRMYGLLERMMPPSIEPGFLTRVMWRTVETLQIAFVGTVFGVLLSLPLAWFASRTLTPLGPLRHVFKTLISLFRTVPDMVWALLFVASIGLGPVAGTMTIIIDTIGFCGRFFAEAIEDADKQPQEALFTSGASRFSVLTGAVIPDIMPSMINTSQFALEKALRSSVVLGLVGAGGIGQELKVAFDLFQYKNASTIILVIFVLVLMMEFATDRLRAKAQ
ncbi:phosphonate transport system permease protein [Sinorhizobium kostiense]|uniref:Phosphonate transport system permease protein n=1 Tax=Sinorhizobium kostiense TaxID=76747 RepID=A0ABS4R890_9HYPH|nr:phosphonate ABC transporter, permease protein PhnE [Sinorhizobium kostiense]MBP2239105.1 phosphonate transport system permease protein [Sinorhizobium kostiense]